MILMRTVLGTLVLPLALAACTAEEPEAAPAAPQPISQAGADAMRNAVVDAVMFKDAARVVAFYADDAVMYGPDGTVYTGKAAIEAGINDMIAAGRDSLALASQSFETSGELATDQGTFITRALDPQTRVATRHSGNYKLVIAPQPDGTYKVVKDSSWATTELR